MVDVTNQLFCKGISIIVPAYNEERLIGDTLRAIRAEFNNGQAIAEARQVLTMGQKLWKLLLLMMGAATTPTI